MKDKLKDQKERISAQIHASHLESNDLEERLTQIPGEIADLKRAVLNAETEPAITEHFERIKGLKAEREQKTLLSRRAKIAHWKSQGELRQIEVSEMRTKFETLLVELPAIEEEFRAAETKFNEATEQVRLLENRIANGERQAALNFQQAAQIENMPLELSETL